MKLNELTIHGFRAFPPGEEEFKFEGDNAVILGDNGTGKSSILAAIEFLLCGNISHISGTGTGDIDIPSHAPHQHANPDECYVEGVFTNDEGDTGTFRRTADDHRTLESVSGDIETEEVEVSQWNDDHLILTRGQMLEFIESTPSNRGDYLSKLLNLSGVQNRASGFDRIKSEISEKVDATESSCQRHINDIGDTLDLSLTYPLTDSKRDDIQDEVNNRLDLLNAGNIDSLDELDSAMENISLEVTGEIYDTFYQTSTQERTKRIIGAVEEDKDKIQKDLRLLSEKLEVLEGIDTRSLNELELFDVAENIVTDEVVECPLCGEDHEEGYLRKRIQEQLEKLSEIQELREEVEELQNQLHIQIDGHRSELSELVDQLREGMEYGDHPEMHEELRSIQEFADHLDEAVHILERSIVEEGEQGLLEVRTFDVDHISPNWSMWEKSLKNIRDYMDDLEPRDDFTEAHADLVRVNDAWKRLTESETKLEELTELESEVMQVVDLYSEAREESIGELYASIQDRFNKYYTTIHPDEDNIDFDFEYDGADSVELEATHGEERDSPLAYHSEGHIDTMGICLFLALQEELDTSGPDIILLDDIVMSIDKNHRRGVVRLLKDYFGNSIQLVLATHDEVWSDQLKERSVVSRNNIINIADWDLSTGPVLNWGNWDLIQQKLDDDEPHGAAAHLRRTAEKLGRIATLRLQASVQFKDRYTLGDYVYAVSGKISDVASSAKGQHPDGSDRWEAAKQIDNARSDLLGDYKKDELNGMVHYNRHDWGQLTAEDLQEVLDHWKHIEEFLTCSTCGSMLQYSEDGDWNWVHCDCRDIEVGYED